ncbi:hypothetical protein ID866_6395, partial [Astraeus odoratus]
INLFSTTPENTVVWSKSFSDFFYEKLGVPPARTAIEDARCMTTFHSMEGTSVAVLRANASKKG